MLILGAALVVVGVSAVFSMLQEPAYVAEADVRITPRDGAGANQSPESFVQDVTATVRTEELLREAAEQAGWSSAESFEQRLTVEPYTAQGESTGILVRFTDSEEERAARSANAYADLFVERMGRLSEDRLVGGSLAAEASLQSRAELSGSSSSPRPVVYAALAAVAGGIVGGVAALLLESRTRSWRGARDAELTLQAPVLGVIPDYPSDDERET